MINTIRNAAILSSALLIGGWNAPPLSAQQPNPVQTTPDAAQPPVQPGVEVLGRGPVHEAFAQPTATDPKPGPEVSKAPPAPINEVPPSEKPEGANVEWIPGYWSWDTDRNDYLWVSGMWRAAPPNRQWVAGKWIKDDNGYRWIHGYWNGTEPNRVAKIVPEPPPQSLEQGPSAPAPNDNATYVPGCWIYGETGYRWRPGFWTTGQANWVWNPDQYNWTPSGYEYNRGYWDYPYDNRGTLFAPVAFDNTINLANYTYYPQYTVGYSGLFNSLFVNPLYGSYYFGDFYGRNYLGLGYYPWFSWGSSYRHYDPWWHYHDWNNRHYGNAGWYNGYRTAYDGRVRDNFARPPRTLAQQQSFNRNVGNTIVNNNRTTINNVNNRNQMLAHYSQVHNHLGPTNTVNGNFRGTGPVTTNYRNQAGNRERPSVNSFAGTLNNRSPNVTAQNGRPYAGRSNVTAQNGRPYVGRPNVSPNYTRPQNFQAPQFTRPGNGAVVPRANVPQHSLPHVQNGFGNQRAIPSARMPVGQSPQPWHQYRPTPSFGSAPSFRPTPNFSGARPNFGGGRPSAGGGRPSAGHHR